MYRVITRSKTKVGGTPMPKVHGGDKVVDPALKPEMQARREGIPKLIPVIPKPVSQPQSITPLFLHREGQQREGARRKIIGPRYQTIPQAQPSPSPLPKVPCRCKPPPTAIHP